MKKSIPPELHAYVQKLAAEGKTSEEIAELLWREQRCETTGRSVRNLLERYRDELATISKGVIREQLGKHLGATVASLEQLHNSAMNQERRALRMAATLREKAATLDVTEDAKAQILAGHAYKSALLYETFALKAKDRRLRAINLALHYSGAGEPDQPTLLTPTKRGELLARLERLVKAETGTPPEVEPSTEPKVH